MIIRDDVKYKPRSPKIAEVKAEILTHEETRR